MVQNFRKSISGFNREDVVQYIEFINNRHNAQLNQLKSELATAQSRVELSAELENALQNSLAERDSLTEQLTAAQAELAALREAAAETDRLQQELAAAQAELASLKDEAAAGAQVLQELADARNEAAEGAGLRQELTAAQTELAAVKLQLQQTRAELDRKTSDYANQELEAYRRAERFERKAMERVAELYAQANAALQRATVGAEDTAVQIGQMADSVSEKLGQMQAVLDMSKQSIQGAADAMKAIRPIETDC